MPPPGCYWYVPVLARKRPGKPGKNWEPALVEIGAVFALEHEQELVRGRLLKVRYRGKDVPLGFELGEVPRDVSGLAKPFECDEAIARMKLRYVPTEPPSGAKQIGSETLPYKRREQA
jgi:hypothetical protein